MTCDAIIIGAGQAGPSLAGRLARAGMNVALVERHLFGGTCVNTGCMPTKTLVASAYAAHLARRASDYGVVLDGDVRIDFPRVMARAHEVSANARAGVERGLRETPNVTVLQGHAVLEGNGVVRVGETTVKAPRIFLNVGGRARVPDLPGVHDVPFLTNTSMLALEELPRHLLVVGGSYIGLEFAQLFRRFGAEVTVIEQGARLVSREDDDVAEAIRDILVREGIAVRTHATCIALARRGNDVVASVDCQAGEPEVVGSHVLLAVGRQPNTADLGLDRAGVTVDAHGYIVVDESLATTAPGIWAMGDCNGRGAFTHTAYNDYEIVAANVIDGQQRRVSDRVSAYALYIDPPLGRVGMTETQARASGRKVLVGTRPMSRVSRAVEKGETLGLMKVVVDADSRRLLGATILGTGGDEAIHALVNAVNLGATVEQLQWIVPIHPTVSELIPTVLGDLR